MDCEAEVMAGIKWKAEDVWDFVAPKKVEEVSEEAGEEVGEEGVGEEFEEMEE